jgi:hypothetical protein
MNEKTGRIIMKIIACWLLCVFAFGFVGCANNSVDTTGDSTSSSFESSSSTSESSSSSMGETGDGTSVELTIEEYRALAIEEIADYLKQKSYTQYWYNRRLDEATVHANKYINCKEDFESFLNWKKVEIDNDDRLKYKTGPLYYVDELYELGKIKYEDWLNFIYWSPDSDSNEELLEGFTPKEIGELPADVRAEIEEYVRDSMLSPESLERLEYIHIGYYGCYNGYYIIRYTITEL